MGTIRTCDSGMWTDDIWFQELDLKQKFIYIYSFTNGHITAAGTFSITLSTLCFETKIDRSEVVDVLQSLSPKLVYFPDHNIFWVRNFYKRQKLGAGSYRTAAHNHLKKLPADVQLVILAEYPELSEPFSKPSNSTPSIQGLDTLSTPSIHPVDTVYKNGQNGHPVDTLSTPSLREVSVSVSGSGSEGSKDPKNPPFLIPPGEKPQKPKKAFVKPSVEDVSAYDATQKPPTPHLIEEFLDHHEMCGWKTRKGPIEDWQAAYRTWRSHDRKYHPAQNGHVDGSSPPATVPKYAGINSADYIGQGHIKSWHAYLEDPDSFDTLKKMRSVDWPRSYIIEECQGHPTYELLHVDKIAAFLERGRELASKQ